MILEERSTRELQKQLDHNLRCIEIWTENKRTIEANISLGKLAVEQIKDELRSRDDS